ncbi:MAG: SulP family inorganic anion transporter [Methanotrichaceae archaeon]|nr:SulP family inorganic anion transporter [Methanotrichaceae archaeon]
MVKIDRATNAIRKSLQDLTSKSIKESIIRRVPIIQWLPNYPKEYLKDDSVAGLIVWALAVPVAISYAQIAGVSPEAGLYTSMIALLLYGIFGASRDVKVAATSSMAILTASIIGSMVAGNTTQYFELTATLAVLTGLIFLLFGIARLGFVSEFMSKPVTTGFIFGMACIIIVSQIPKILGIQKVTGSFFEELRNIIIQLGNVNSWSVLVGVTALILIAFLRRKFPQYPAAMIAFVYGVLLYNILNLETHGVAVVGDIATGIPQIGLPSTQLSDYITLLPGAFALVIVGLSETMGVAKTYAQKNRYETDSNQELIGLGIANIGSGMGNGFAVDASLSTTATSNESGSKTQITSLVAGLLVLLTMLFLAPIFHNVPQAILGAIVIYAVWNLLNYRELNRYRLLDPKEFWLSMLALLGVLTLGVLEGLIVAVGVSIIRLAYDASKPHIAILGKVPGRNIYGDIERHPENEQIPGLIIFRPDEQLFFANADKVRAFIQTITLKNDPTPETIIIDMDASYYLDISSTDMLSRLIADLKAVKLEVLFAGLKGNVRDTFRKRGLTQKTGEDKIFRSLQDAVDYFIDIKGSASKESDEKLQLN